MRKITYPIVLAFVVLSCGEPPLVFTEEVKQEEAVTFNNERTTLNEVFNGLKGQVVLVDVWATWCRDCLEGFPRVKELQQEYPEVAYLLLSVDRTQKAWKNGIAKYQLVGQHYFLSNGQKGALGDFLNSNWIPRYMILDKEGNIALYKAKNANDKDIVLTLDKLTN